MKKLTVAISAVAASVLMAMSAQAAEIYNKDSNKLDLYGKVNAKHYFSSNDADDGDFSSNSCSRNNSLWGKIYKKW